jgi:perosamine synthetase
MTKEMDMFKDINSTLITDFIKYHDISGWFGNNDGGELLQTFQHGLAQECNTKYAFGTSSGSAAIYVALKACNVGRGDHVIVPAYTHIGSIAPIILAGAEPIFVDVDIHGNIDPEQLDFDNDFDNPIAKALIAVHMLGMPCDMDKIKKKFSGYIIEDASHALGSEYKEKRAGSLGHIGCFSIGGGRTKTIGCGEGGMITTSDKNFAERCKNLRNHGDRVTDVDYPCFNFRMSELIALIGLLQLPRLQMLNDWQRRNAETIIKELPDCFVIPPIPSYAKTVRYMLGTTFKHPKMSRNEFLSKLKEKKWNGGEPRRNIGSGWSKLINDINYYKDFHKRTVLPMSYKLRDESVWFDWHRFARTDAEVKTMINHVKKVLK